MTDPGPHGEPKPPEVPAGAASGEHDVSTAAFDVTGQDDAAPFTLRIHRGEGAALLAMNWRDGTPPDDFVGFAVEYREPGGDRRFVLENRLGFTPGAAGDGRRWLPTTLAPIQKFRWVHFPRNAELDGPFAYTVTPVFMNEEDQLSYGTPQHAAVPLRRETYPGQLNVAFTRGFVSSQAFVDRYERYGKVSTILPTDADKGLTFHPTHPRAAEALVWMGFEARRTILGVLDEAIADDAAEVRVIAYDLNEPEVVTRLERLGSRLRIIIDDSDAHGRPGSAETAAERRLRATAGDGRVQRQHMGDLQHNKTIVVDGPATNKVIFGSTNFTWRGLFVQNNNAVEVHGATAVELATRAFGAYWDNPEPGDVAGFAATRAAQPASLGLDGIDASLACSPHGPDTAMLGHIGDDIRGTTSSLLYSLAFLSQTKGAVRDAIAAVTARDDRFVYGVADHPVDGLELHRPGGNVAPVFPTPLSRDDVPPPFRPEPTGGSGVRLHHKFVVIDFDRPTARVYTGSYNFSVPADTRNGENLLVIRDRRVAVAYAVEALRIFDHYSWRVARREAGENGEPLVLRRPPRAPGETPWWREHYTDPARVRDREVFA